MAQYHLSRSLPASAKVSIGSPVTLYIDGDAVIDAAVVGDGAYSYITVVGSASALGNLKGYSGHIALGDFTQSGTLTLPAGQERNVVIDDGTLYLTLDKAQVAYGYSTSEIDIQIMGAVVFQDEAGNELARWTSRHASAL